MTDAQELIAEVAVTHALRYDEWAIADSDIHACDCGWKAEPGTGASEHEWAKHLATEIDKALGGLRKFTSTGRLLPGGFLTPVYAGTWPAPGAEPKTYAHWISGWSEVTR